MKKLFDSRLKSVIWTIVETFLLALVIGYLWLPAINLRSADFWNYGVFILILCVMVSFLNNWIRSVVEENKTNIITYCDSFSDFRKKYTLPFVVMAILVVYAVVFMIAGIAGSKLVNAKKYCNIITVEDGNFSEDVFEINSDDVVIVDVKTAQRLGDRTIGTIQNASWYDVDDEYNLISINGEQYRISPLKYNGFLKWVKAKKYGIPGYVLVNAKTQEAEYVQLEEEMKYSPTAFFSEDLTRHLRNQYPTYVFGKSFFEVDDDGNPYWITSVKTAQIGLFSGKKDTSAVITNAITGESSEYAIDNLPEWVDHVSSVSDLMQLVEWHYRYTNGFLNLSDTGVYKTTYSYRSSKSSSEENKYTPFEGYNSVLTKDGEIMFYTGITPKNSAESNIGFVLINPRNGKVTFYNSTGAEESSAQLAAEGLVSNLRYSASFPTVVNIEGLETYFMVLKDDAGLVHKYAFCNVANYSKCVEADTISEALEKYKQKMELTSTVVTPNESQDETTEESETPILYLETTGTVMDVKEAQIEGYTYYYFTLLGNDTIFMSSIRNSNKQPMKLVEGVEITVEYYNSTEDGIAIVTAIEF